MSTSYLRWLTILHRRTSPCKSEAERRGATARDQFLPAQPPDLFKFYGSDISISLHPILNPAPIMFPQGFFDFQLLAYILGKADVFWLLAVDMDQSRQYLDCLSLCCFAVFLLCFHLGLVPFFLAVVINLRKLIVRWDQCCFL